MATVVSIMDRPGWSHRTDNIVVALPASRELVWVPRDLYCHSIGDRINIAFQLGGHRLLILALAEQGLSVDFSLCLPRRTAERLVDTIDVELPIDRPLRFRYPLNSELPIDQGERLITFSPPGERLRGERVHQWIGARFSLHPKGRGDLDRCERQQALVMALLKQGADFRAVLRLEHRVSDPRAFEELSQVDERWSLKTLGPLRDTRHAGQATLSLTNLRHSWWRKRYYGFVRLYFQSRKLVLLVFRVAGRLVTQRSASIFR